jgi:indolepyruvate ferredoxin oxidoreductase
MRDDSVSLEDKYARTDGRIFLTGVQALVRLLLVQARRDRSQGLCTRGFVSGYRGSPLGGLDQQLWRARAHLEAAGVRFQPGLNEDLAATAIAGTQQLEALPGATCDGVFGLWYGKAPGLDRSGDALRHGNAAGSAAHGGVLVVAGDDHACKSSTLPSQSEPAFVDLGMPVLNPAGVQEVLDYGLLGWALSRFAGCWVGLVALADTMDSSATVDADANRVRIVRPAEFEAPPGGLHFRVGRGPLEQEALVLRHRLDAALAFARANGLDRTVIDSPRARLGIVTTGKAHLDALQALDDLGIDGDGASALGLRVYKVGLSWPLEPTGLRRFAEGLDEILVVEEKRGLVEGQIKELLYDAGRPGPRVLGKRDEGGRELLPAGADLSPGLVARALAGRLPEAGRGGRVRARLAELEAGERILAAAERVKPRTPFFCAGCPHNTSTRLPAESHAIAGIGCHYMVRWMERRTDVVAQMGGEGMHWVGQAPFTETRHVFVNIGDGTYQHSGILAVRAALAARVNVTFKILFNDAVAMTGGQKVDGRLSVAQITRQLAAEGVERIALVNARGAPLEGCAPGSCGRRPAARRSSSTRPARPRCGGAASAGSRRIPSGGSSSTRRSARDAATARSSPAASRSSPSRPSSGASARSINRAATRTTPASRACVLRWSACAVGGCAGRGSTPPSRARRCAPCPSPIPPRWNARGTSWWPASAARASSPSARCWAWRRTWRGGAPRCST